MTENTKEKISKAHKGKKHSKKHIANLVTAKIKGFLKRTGITEEERIIYWPRFRDYMHGARQREIDFKLTLEEFKKFWQKECNYCGEKIMTIGLDRIDNEMGYEIDNITACCEICNYMKRNFTKEIFIEHCKKIVKNQLTRSN